MRRKGIRVASDDRILGSGEFVQNLISEVDKRAKETLRLSSKLTDLATLGRKIAKDQGLQEGIEDTEIVLSVGGKEDGVSGSGGGAICRREHFGSGSGCQFRGSA
jgi:hypothetical protein